MSTNEESNPQLDAVAVFRIVMPHICQYLNRKDLCNLAEACESWRDDVLHEKNRRRRIQQLRLLYKFGNLDSRLQVEPYASLLIYDSKLEKALPSEKLPRLKKKVLKHFEKKLPPHKVIVLNVEEYLTTEDVDCADAQDQDELKVTRNIHCGILGLFFPRGSRQLHVRVAWKPGIRVVDYAYLVANRFADKLHLTKRPNLKSTLLLFIQPYEPGSAVVANIFRQRITDRETLWVGEVGGELVAANFHNKSHRQNKKKTIAAIRIWGPTVESWSERVDLQQPREDVERQLNGLRERVTLKTHCIALLAAPCTSRYGNSHDIMRDIKRIFPGIPFVGLFDSHHISVCTEDSRNVMLLIEGYVYMSLIIITYD